MSDASAVSGGCLCGEIRYEAEVYLDKANYCHCRMCQKSSGTPAEVAVMVKPGTLRFTREEPKNFQSSHIAKRGFCPNCGSRLVWRSLERPDEVSLTVGSLDHPENVVLSEHICVESQLPWYRIDENLPRKRSDDDPDLVAAWAKAGLSHDGHPLK